MHVVTFVHHTNSIFIRVYSRQPIPTPRQTPDQPLLTKKKGKKTDLLSSSHKSLLEFIMLYSPPPQRLSTRLRSPKFCVHFSFPLPIFSLQDRAREHRRAHIRRVSVVFKRLYMLCATTAALAVLYTACLVILFIRARLFISYFFASSNFFHFFFYFCLTPAHRK